MSTSTVLHNAWEVSEQIQNLADSEDLVGRTLKNNGLRFASRNGWFSNDDILKPSVGLLCFKAAMVDVLSALGLAIIQFKHEGNFRFSGTCISLGGVDSVTMSYHGDSDSTISHVTAWLCMANESIRTHLGVE